MEEAVSERRMAFSAAHRSEKDRQIYISASRHASSVIAKANAEAWQATCSSVSLLNLIINQVYSLLHSVAFHLPPPPTFPTVLFPERRLRSSPTT